MLHMDCSIKDVRIDEIVHVVLRNQKQEAIQTFIDKLKDEDIKKGSDLLRGTAHALEMKFALKGHFSLVETGYINEIRTWAEKRSGRPWESRWKKARSGHNWNQKIACGSSVDQLDTSRAPWNIKSKQECKSQCRFLQPCELRWKEASRNDNWNRLRAYKKGYGRFDINRAPWNITRDMKSWFGNRPTKVRTSDWTNRRSKGSWNQRKLSGKGYARFDMSSAPWQKPAEKTRVRGSG